MSLIKNPEKEPCLSQNEVGYTKLTKKAVQRNQGKPKGLALWQLREVGSKEGKHGQHRDVRNKLEFNNSIKFSNKNLSDDTDNEKNVNDNHPLTDY